MQTTRIFLADDHASFRQALALVLDREEEFSVVGEAGSLAEAREFLKKSQEGIDVAVVDLTLPDGNGEELVRQISMERPQTQTLVLSASTDPYDYAQAVEAGAAGVLHKAASIRETVNAVRRLRAGEALLSPYEIIEMLREASRGRREEEEVRRAIESLTPREREVLQALSEGLDGQEIARKLSITVETERTHMVNILKKLGVHSRLQALVFAVRHSIVDIH